MVFNDTVSFSIMVYFVSSYDVFHSAYAARRVLQTSTEFTKPRCVSLL